MTFEGFFQKLFGNEEDVSDKNIKFGSKGENVKLLQEALEKLGFKLTQYGIDSKFGKETLGQVKSLINFLSNHEEFSDYVDGLDNIKNEISPEQQQIIIELSEDDVLKNKIKNYFETIYEKIGENIIGKKDLVKNISNPEEFISKLVNISNSLQINPNWLMLVIWKESRFNPKIQNSKTNATGLIQWMPNCLSIDTQILTTDGWKYYNEVKIGDSILSYNSEKDIVEFDIIQELYISDSDNTYRIYNQQFDFIATYDHRWYCDYNGKTSVYTTEELSKLNSKHKFIRAKKFINQENDINPLFFELLGIIVGDGSLNKRNHNITIYQSLKAKPNIVNRIQFILDTLYPNKYKHSKINKDGMVRWFITVKDSKIIYEYLNKNKELVKSKLFNLTQEQLLHLKNGYLETDGTLKYNIYQVFIQCDEERMNDFQLICFLLGEMGNVKCYKRLHETHIFPNGKIYNVKPIKYHCHIQKSSSLTEARKCRMKYEKINDIVKVWCPQTNNKTWIAKRNGFITITGNTAKDLGTTVQDIQNMNAIEQLNYVYKYFKRFTGRMKSVEDLYLATFFPIALGKDDDFVLQTDKLRADKVATSNPAIDLNKDEEITVGEFKKYVTNGIPNEWKELVSKKSLI